MQKTKTVTIDGLGKITVRELSVRQIRDIIEHPEKFTDTQYLAELLAMGTDLDPSVLMETYPSELEEIYAAFTEVNAAFLDRITAILARPPGAQLIDDLIDQILTQASAGLSTPATPIPSLTDTNGSVSASPNLSE